MDKTMEEIFENAFNNFCSFGDEIRKGTMQINMQFLTSSGNEIGLDKTEDIVQGLRRLEGNDIKIKFNKDKKKAKEWLTNLIKIQQKLYLSFVSTNKSIIQSSIDLLPVSSDNKEIEEETERINIMLNLFLELLSIADHQIQSETNSLLDLVHAIAKNQGTKIKLLYYPAHIQDKKKNNSDSIPFRFQTGIYNLTSQLTSLNYMSLFGISIRQKIYECFYVSKDPTKISEITDILNQLQKALLPGFNELKNDLKQTIKNTKESIDLENQIIKNQATNSEKNSKVLENIEDKVNRRNRAERTKPLKLTTCLDAIEEVYKDERYTYRLNFELHIYSIKKKLSAWNQYLKTNGKKGEPPLPDFSIYRCTTKETFKTWVINTFFPHYRDHTTKYDALKSAIHGTKKTE